MFILFIIAATFLAVTEGGFGGGSSAYGNAGNEAVSEINAHSGIAQWSAMGAVASAVGRDYANQLGTTAQFTAQFTAPVTKQQANQAFNSVRHQQEGSLISAALANAAPAIQHASDTASRQNFDQAYAAAEGSRLMGNYNEAQSHSNVLLSGSALASQQLSDSQSAHYADLEKTSQTQTNANALQAIQGIHSVNQRASYGK